MLNRLRERARTCTAETRGCRACAQRHCGSLPAADGRKPVRSAPAAPVGSGGALVPTRVGSHLGRFPLRPQLSSGEDRVVAPCPFQSRPQWALRARARAQRSARSTRRPRPDDRRLSTTTPCSRAPAPQPCGTASDRNVCRPVDQHTVTARSRAPAGGLAGPVQSVRWSAHWSTQLCGRVPWSSEYQ